MPIYEYACTACGTQFELLLRNSSPPPACPGCNSTELRKKMSAFAAITGAASAHAELSAPCQSCANPDGPGACAFGANRQ